MQVEITAEQINEIIANQVAQSLIGKAVKESVERQVQTLSSSYNNPIDQVVKDEVLRILRQTVESEPYRSVLERKVKEAVESQVVDDIASRVVSRAFQIMSREWS